MNSKALHKLSYGLYIVTSMKDNAFNGQVANSVIQISSDPASLVVSINKKNLTNEFIKSSKRLAVSVLSQEVPLSLIGRFGFKSGRDIDKFAGVNYMLTGGGLPYIAEFSLAYLEAAVIDEMEASTHDLFLCELTGAEVLNEGIPMTYAYYQQMKRGSAPQNAASFAPDAKERRNKMDRYVCSACGYVYDPEVGDPENDIPPNTSFEDLPDDWTCPVCGVGKDEFEKED
ncbi:MAG: rubredoxin [Bacillota bacterium]|nr:rubredoxin [Bacillota bacterium]